MRSLSFVRLVLGSLAFLCVTGASAAAQKGVESVYIAIVGGTVYPVSGPPIEHGTVLIHNDKIVAVGSNVSIPADAHRLDATGKIVTPGLIHAATQLGVEEVLAVNDTRDVTAQGENNVAAAFRVWNGLNSQSALIPAAREEGITSVVVTPTGGLIAGQAAIIDLSDGPAPRMIRKAPAAMVAQVNTPPDAGTGARGELVGKLRMILDEARYYSTHRNAYDRNATRPVHVSRDQLEALQPVLRRTIPLIITANRADDIVNALGIAKDYHIRVIIGGGAEAWMVVDRIAVAHVGVLTGAMNNIPSSFETLNQRQENAMLLAGANIPVAIIGNAGDSDEGYYNVRNVKYEAGNAVSYGMSHEAALRAVTLTPAELFGVSDHVGALKAGMDANVVVWSGDPFEFSTTVEHVFIHGADMRMGRSRQDLLTDRYKSRTATGH